MDVSDGASASAYGAAPMGLDASKGLAALVAATRYSDLSQAAVVEARRGVLDWLGCAIAGNTDEMTERLFRGLSVLGGWELVPALGSTRRFGPFEAAIANGALGHVHDFDDTHLGQVVLHTSSPVLGAIISASYLEDVTGKDLILAYAMAFEAGVRIGRAAPNHHDGGWHPTGTIGCLAAAAGAARLLNLTPQQTNFALGLAAGQAAGMQQNRGTMAKSFQSGKAAANGFLSAIMARENLDSSPEIIEGRRGFARIYNGPPVLPEALTQGWGETWEIAQNGYKPYACGVVLHPAIDATLALARDGVPVDQIERMEFDVHPTAVRVTGIRQPESGLQSKFSLHHSAAVAYIDGNAGVAQYSDVRATASDVAALRECISATIDESFRREEARGRLVLRDGRVIEAHVPFATGCAQNPVSYEALERKFMGNVAPLLGDARAREIAARVQGLEKEASFRDLIELCRAP